MAPINLETLTDSEIRNKFIELGSPVGPITSTTRRIYLKKLKTLLEDAGETSCLLDQTPTSPTFHSSRIDDTRDGSRNRRRSLPRSTNKSPSRKSPARLNVNMSQIDSGSSPRTPKVNVSIIPPARSSLVQDSTNNFSITSSSDVFESPRSVSEISSRNFGGAELDTQHGTQRILNSALGVGLNGSIRPRFPEPVYDGEFNSPISQTGVISSSFSSDFMKRLSAGSSPRPEFRTSGGIPSKLLDVKESDDEDTSPAPVYAKFSQSTSRVHPVTSMKHVKGPTPSDGWLPFDSAISTSLLVFFMLFFLVIGVAYINMHSTETNLTSPTDIVIPICLKVQSHIPGENCIQEADKDTVLRLFNILYKVIFDKMGNAACNEEKKENITDDEVVNMMVEQDKTMSVWVVEQHLRNLKVLLEANPKWNIKPSGLGISVIEPPSSVYCSVMSNVYFIVNWTAIIGLAGLVILLSRELFKWWMKREARYKNEVFKLVTNIIDIVSNKALTADGVVPVYHVRDQLIPPKDRDRLSKHWKAAMTVLESDSRLRFEVQQVEGEEFLVWRWLANSPINNKRKVWQGQAFDTMEGSVNSLPHSPTAYLKIRHMFDAYLEEGDDWETTVVNALLEKCGEAKVLHVVVDKQSREGCVYMKCASPMDAGIAFRSLHGSWFDSKLVTVKYIREKRYLERFPESATCVQPLQPTDPNKNSLN